MGSGGSGVGAVHIEERDHVVGVVAVQMRLFWAAAVMVVVAW